VFNVTQNKLYDEALQIINLHRIRLELFIIYKLHMFRIFYSNSLRIFKWSNI